MSFAADSLVHLLAAAISGSTSRRSVVADLILTLLSAPCVPQAPGERQHGARYSTLVRKGMVR